MDIPPQWIKEQEEIRDKILTTDVEDWQKFRSAPTEEQGVPLVSSLERDESVIQYVGGVDLSYVKNDTKACVALVVCKLPHLEASCFKGFSWGEIHVWFG